VYYIFFVSTGNESRNCFRLSIHRWHTMQPTTMDYSRGLVVVPPMDTKDTFPALANGLPTRRSLSNIPPSYVLMISDLLGSYGFLLVALW